MERLNQNNNLDVLCRANSSIDLFFERFAEVPVLGTGEEISALLQIEVALRSVGSLLNGELQSSADGGIRVELARYRENLLHLHRELGRMEQSAESTRSRLGARREHLHAAQAWCAASQAIS